MDKVAEVASYADIVAALALELLSWIPVVAEPSAPIATDPATGEAVVAVDKVAAAIYAYNTTRAYFATASQLTIPAKQVVIHKLSLAQANAQSPLFQAGAKQFGLDLPFTLACTAEESVFDPNCQNGNAGPGESNFDPNNPQGASPLGYDMGEEQLKLRYLIGYKGIATAAEADAFALDPSKAIPYFCSIMAGKIEAAKLLIAQSQPNASAIDARLLASPELVATGCYNFGLQGFTENYFEKGQFPSHCQQVRDLTDYFAKALGVPSIFANLPQ